MAITPDTKNWTWVLDRPCPEFGFDAAATDFREVPDLLRGSAEDWQRILTDTAAAQRPDDGTWSPLEYAAHVRDLCDVYRMRLNLMLEDDGAEFAGHRRHLTARSGKLARQAQPGAARGK